MAEQEHDSLEAVRFGALGQAWNRLAEADELYAQANELTREAMAQEEEAMERAHKAGEAVNWAAPQPFDSKISRAKSYVIMAKAKREAASEWFKLAELAREG